MKTVPVKLGEGGPIIGTCTIDEKNKTMSIVYDEVFLNSYKNSWWRDGKPPKLPGISVMYDFTEIEKKVTDMNIVDMVVTPECGTCEMKAIKEKDVESIEIKL